MNVRRVVLGLVALLVGLVAASMAPEEWSAGDGALEVRYRGQLVLDAPIELDDEVPVELRGSGASASAPEGFPLDETIELVIDVAATDGEPSLGDLDVTIVRPGGETAVVLVLAVDGASARAELRPPSDAAVVLGVLGAAIVLWIAEVVPLFVTALGIPVVLTVADAGSAQAALAPFFDPIIVLFFAGFLMAEAMRRVELDHLLAVTIVDLAGRGPVRLYATLLSLSAVLSMFMSNTAAVTLLLPVATAVTEPLRSVGYRKATVLGIAYAATIGGVGSAIGTPANPLAISFIDDLTGRTVSFVEWFGFGLPMVVAFLPIMGSYLWFVSRVDIDADRMSEAAAVARAARRSAGGLSGRQVQVVVVFGVVVALWLTQSWHQTSTGIVALAGTIVLFAIGRLEPDDLARISWPTLLTFGGGLTLGVFMVSSGTSDWLVTSLDGLGSWPDTAAIAAVAVVALGMTTVASNTAAAATLIPLAVPLASLLGLDPVLLVVVVAIATSIDFALVIGTPPTMLAYSTDLFSVREILAKGAVLDVVGIVLLVALVVPVWTLFGLT